MMKKSEILIFIIVLTVLLSVPPIVKAMPFVEAITSPKVAIQVAQTTQEIANDHGILLSALKLKSIQKQGGKITLEYNYKQTKAQGSCRVQRFQVEINEGLREDNFKERINYASCS